LNLSIGVRSLLLQIGCVVLTYFLLLFLKFSFNLSVSLLFALMLHCSIAGIAALILRFDWWWSLIQFSFPLVVCFAYQQNISPHIYLFGLFVLSVLYWSTYRTQVPYYPSKSILIEPILGLLPVDRDFSFVDLGSGMGGLLLKLSRRTKLGRYYGIEIAPLPWLISTLRAMTAKTRVEINFGSYTGFNLASFDVVFCYLSPAVMPSIWAKVRAEMTPGSIFLSYEFVVPGVEPDLRFELEPNGPILFGWRI
jgi:SAM-dependent methyltransferase